MDMDARRTSFNLEVIFWNIVILMLTGLRRLHLGENSHLMVRLAFWAALGFLIGLLVGSLWLIRYF